MWHVPERDTEIQPPRPRLQANLHADGTMRPTRDASSRSDSQTWLIDQRAEWQ
jgi:YD repeat-containing protein